MQQTLEDYLSFSRPLEDVRLEPLQLDRLVRDLASLLEPNAERQAVQLELDLEPVQVMADPARLKDAVLNLAANALAAMPSGGTLRLRVHRDGERASIGVSDTGSGMSADELAAAATPFVSGRDGGTGLGLALARGVARQHGGDLHIESRPALGTSASLSLATISPAGVGS